MVPKVMHNLLRINKYLFQTKCSIIDLRLDLPAYLYTVIIVSRALECRIRRNLCWARGFFGSLLRVVYLSRENGILWVVSSILEINRSQKNLNPAISLDTWGVPIQAAHYRAIWTRRVAKFPVAIFRQVMFYSIPRLHHCQSELDQWQLSQVYREQKSLFEQP